MSGGESAGRGAAGRRGDDVRSDLWVGIEARDAGGIELTIRSRVAPYYGEAIERQLRELLAHGGVEHAAVQVEDTGALPFVIAARVEAALLQAGFELPAPSTELELRPAGDDDRFRTRRSRLYLPGNEPKYMVNAGLYRPDGIILDLEDSVHPEAKSAARLLVRNALRTLDFGIAERMVRINQLPLGLEDLAAIVPQRPDLVLIPKVETADQVREVDRAIDAILGDAATERPLWLMPILENALGIEHAFAIARVSRRIVALTIGLEDYAADLGVPRSADGRESDFARRRLVNAARAAGLQAIDSVYGQVDDLDGLAAWAADSRRLGFEGMGCLHPRQIPVIHQAFDPQPEELERAQRIAAAYDQAQEEGLGVVSLGSKMIDAPVVRQALRVVEQGRRLGLLPREESE